MLSKKINLLPNNTFAKIKPTRFEGSVSYPEKVSLDHDFSMPLPRRYDIFSAPVLNQKDAEPIRKGADDHKNFLSKGF